MCVCRATHGQHASAQGAGSEAAGHCKVSVCAITHECEWPRVQCLRVQGPLVLPSTRASTTTHTHSACQVCTGGAGAAGCRSRALAQPAAC